MLGSSLLLPTFSALAVDDIDERGWGAAFTGHVSLPRQDRVMFSSVYGEAMGRYLLGIQSTSGGAIEPGTGEISKRDNWGGMVAYEHHWSDSWRSTAMAGYAKADPLDWQPGDTFKSSTYASINLMWQALPYLNVGVEYGYGARERKDGSDVDNHRVALGFQLLTPPTTGFAAASRPALSRC